MKYSILTALLVLGTAFATAEDKPAAAKPEAAKEIMLFNGKSLDDWESVDVGGSGEVELEGGLMIINQGENVSGAIYKKAAALPTTNYEITLEAKRMQGRYKDDEWYAIKLRVTPKNLSVWLGDKQIIDEDIEGKKISVRSGPIESYLPLSLTTFNTTAAIRNVKLTPITEPK
ncbi:MAG: hypothetical protein NTY98_19690 [Verrucomicrobia bacterium]|nr:hypothetical protein [Verrucomicrobiota bacterium]